MVNAMPVSKRVLLHFLNLFATQASDLQRNVIDSLCQQVLWQKASMLNNTLPPASVSEAHPAKSAMFFLQLYSLNTGNCVNNYMACCFCMSDACLQAKDSEPCCWPIIFKRKIYGQHLVIYWYSNTVFVVCYSPSFVAGSSSFLQVLYTQHKSISAK